MPIMISTKEIAQLVKNCPIENGEKEQLTKLLEEYKDLMAAGLCDEHPAGGSFFIPHRIKLKNSDPIWTPQFRRAYKEEELQNEEALKLAKQGVIERATTSEYNSPVMVVPKKDGTWRSVIDYRNINKETIKEN